jgi:hypothetical protein
LKEGIVIPTISIGLSTCSNVTGSVVISLRVRPSTSKKLIPLPPPVKPGKRLTIAGAATAIANVARAR